MENELKPCPFCGSRARAIRYLGRTTFYDNVPGCKITCEKCGIEIRKLRTLFCRVDDSVDKAYEAWNRRFTDGVDDQAQAQG